MVVHTANLVGSDWENRTQVRTVLSFCHLLPKQKLRFCLVISCIGASNEDKQSLLGMVSLFTSVADLDAVLF